MKKIILLLLVIVCVPLQARLRNREQLKNCQTYLLPDDVLRAEVKKVDAPSVLVTGQSLPGLHGGRLLIAVKYESYDSWFSRYQIVPAAGQGDPRMLTTLLGSPLAHFFGIRQISEHEITIPDMDEMNGAIKTLNAALIELGYKPIPISFFKMGEAKHNSRAYIESFASKFQLPFATDLVLMLHDISLHIQSVAFPVEILVPIGHRYQLAVKFYDYAKTHALPSFFFDLDKEYFHHLDRTLDEGSASIGVAYFNRAQRWNVDEALAVHRTKTYLKQKIEEWLHGDADLETSMKNVIKSTFKIQDREKKSLIENLSAEVKDQVKAQMNKTYFNYLLNRFLKQPHIATTLTETRSFKPEETYDLIEKRVTELKAAYELLKSRGEVPAANLPQ